MPRTDDLAKNLALMAAAIILLIIILEAAFSLFHVRSDNMRMAHAVVGNTFIPNKEGYIVTPASTVRITANSDGFNDKEYSIAKGAGTLRIAVIGDSYVEASHVALEDSFHKVLERRLGGIGKYEVMAFGISGWGSDQEYLAMKHFVLKYKPDLIILLYTNNNVKNVMPELERDKCKPYFRLSNGSLEPLPFTPCRKDPLRALLAESKFIAFVYERAASLIQGDRTADYKIPMSVYYKEYPPAIEQGWQLSEALVLKMKADAQSGGSEFMMVTNTMPEQVHEDLLGEILMASGVSSDAIDLEKPNKILTQFATDNNITYLDLLPAFKAAASSARLHHSLEGHWNEAGHELAAQEIEKKLRSEGFLD